MTPSSKCVTSSAVTSPLPDPFPILPLLFFINHSAKLLRQAEHQLAEFGVIKEERLHPAVYSGDLIELRNAFVKVLGKLADTTGQILVIVDALDELEELPDDLEALPEYLPEGVHILLTARPEQFLLQALRARLHPLEERSLPPLQPSDLPMFIKRHLGQSALQELENKVNWERFFELTGGNPLFLRHGLEQIAKALKCARQFHQDIESIDFGIVTNQLDMLFEHIYNEIGGKTAQGYSSEKGLLRARLCHYLALAKAPLRMDDLQGLLRCEGHEITLEEIHDLVYSISEYLVVIEGDKFSLYHEGLAEYIRRKVLGDTGVKKVHGIFYQWLQSPKVAHTSYRLSYQLSHLHSASDVHETLSTQKLSSLIAHLTDITYVADRVQMGEVFELIREYQKAMKMIEKAPDLITQEQRTKFRHFFRFIDNHSHWLAPMPELFYQLAISQSEDHAVTRSAEMFLPKPSLYLHWRNRPQRVRPSPLMRTLIGHTDQVDAVAVTPDGRYAISGGRDTTLKIWDVATGECLYTFRGHKKAVFSIAIPANGKYIISGSWDGTIKVWDRTTRKCLRTLKGHLDGILAVDTTPDGQYIVSGSDDETLKVWNLTTGECIRTLKGHTSGITSIAITPDSRFVISGSRDTTLKIWDIQTGKCLHTLRGHKNWILGLAVTPDGQFVISGSWDRTLKEWDIITGQCVRTFKGHKDWVITVVVTPDSRFIISGSRDATLKVWDRETGQCIRTIYGHMGGIRCLAIVPHSSYVISGSKDASLKIWDISMDIVFQTPIVHEDCVRTLAITPNGRHAISGSSDKTLKIWDLGTCQCLGTIEGHTDWVRAVAISPDGRFIISGSEDRKIKVWNITTGQCNRTLIGHASGIMAVAVTPNGRWIISGSRDTTLKVWNLQTGQCVRTLKGHTNSIRAVAITPDSRYAISGSDDKTLKVWDILSGRCVQTLEGHTNKVEGIAVDPQGRFIISCSRDKTLKMWEIKTGQCVRTFIGHTRRVNTIAITPDGRYAISGSRDKTLKVWDIASGECVVTFPVQGEIYACAAGPNGNIACGDRLGSIYFLMPMCNKP